MALAMHEHVPPEGQPPAARPWESLGLRLALGAVLAYGVGFWMVGMHVVEGGHESGEPPLLLHWLRDATLAFTPTVLAVLLATALSARAVRARPATPGLAWAVTASAAACATSVAFALGNPVHEALFGAHEGRNLALAVHLARDGLACLPVALALAFTSLLLADVPWRSLWERRWHQTRLVVAPAAAVAGAVVMLGSAASTPVIAADSPAPCTANAPLKQFLVQSIDLRITINRFGDNDPFGKMYVGVPGTNQADLDAKVAAAKAQAASRQVSVGLRTDAVQPLVIRANEGDCVQIRFTNGSSAGAYGVHVDGLSFATNSSGDLVGTNATSATQPGATRTYTYYVPNDARLEGGHYLHPGMGNREAVSHGLFGALIVEPPGSVYLDPNDATGTKTLTTGWEAIIQPADRAAFREYALLFHEFGNEDFDIRKKNGTLQPKIDPFTGSYRPGSRAINYRSEPFGDRLAKAPLQESQGYGSYAFGDPATPWPRAYLGDPTKIRLMHTGGEVFHVFHLHGGGDRWRFNPLADTTYDYTDTGLNKVPSTQNSPSTRLDSQSIGPGESYNLEIEGGAGGVQQAAGDFLWHCHIAQHYIGGMWAFWRVYNTLQPDFARLPDRDPLPVAVDSSQLIGRHMQDGTDISAANLDDWIRPQLPPQGTPRSSQDASVWNWTVDRSDPNHPVYLGEPDDKTTWVDQNNLVAGHPFALAGDRYPAATALANRPVILFNPYNGRPAFPLLRTHVGKRPPFSPNGHSGAPYLGENGDAAPASTTAPDPFARRRDGLCPAGAPMRSFNVVAIEKPVQVTRAGGIDPAGGVFVLAQNKDRVLASENPEPLALRSNIGDCDAVTLTSEQSDPLAFNGFAKVNMHIHHVQFDPQGSDGVITGMSFEQSVRPYKLEDPRLTAATVVGATTLKLSSTKKFALGVAIGVGLGTNGIEIRRITAKTATTVTLDQPLKYAHPVGEWAGVEFVQYRWYPDVQLDNIFWHDHVDGIHGWSHGFVGQLIIEPKGSTYHDPKTGDEVASGTIVDIHTTNPVVPNVLTGSFREIALWTIDDNVVTDSTVNLRAEPWASRLAANGDPSLLFSSYTHGDPFTPLPRGYAGDPFVIRTINVGQNVDSLHVDGHRVFYENRYVEDNATASTPGDTIHYGVSERFTLVLHSGSRAELGEPGDYLYNNGIGRRFRQGAWGILRVLGQQVDDLKPLPGLAQPPPGGGPLPAVTGGRPPDTSTPGNPCPALSSPRSFNVSAIDVPSSVGASGALDKGNPTRAAFVLTSAATRVRNGTTPLEPLVLHVAEGDCITVHLSNQRTGARASFHAGELLRTIGSGGANIGFDPEQTVAPGATRDYVLYADTARIGAALVSDWGGTPLVPPNLSVDVDTGQIGMYGAIDVAPRGATFTNPGSGQQATENAGASVDVHLPDGSSYRDFTLLFADRDPRIGQNVMPYPVMVDQPALINYRSTPRTVDTGSAFSTSSGVINTPTLRAYAGDPVHVHVLVAQGSEQLHVFHLGGLSWPIDPAILHSDEENARAVAPFESIDAEIIGGAGGRNHTIGDLAYGDQGRAFAQAGMWGLQSVLFDASCPIRPLDGRSCTPGG